MLIEILGAPKLSMVTTIKSGGFFVAQLSIIKAGVELSLLFPDIFDESKHARILIVSQKSRQRR